MAWGKNLNEVRRNKPDSIMILCQVINGILREQFMTEQKNKEDYFFSVNKKDTAKKIIKKELHRSWEWFKPTIYIAVLYFSAALIYHFLKDFSN